MLSFPCYRRFRQTHVHIEYSMRPIFNNLVPVIWLLAISLHSSACTEARSIHHEIHAGVSWSGEHANYHQYISAGETNPLKSESFERNPFSASGTYTVFLSSFVPQPHVPASLWEFYQHPSTVSLAFTLQPEARMTNIHDDPALRYHRSTATDERLRSLTVFGEHYVLPHIGISANFAVSRTDDDSRTHISAGDTQSQRTGQNKGLRHQYGLGVSRYVNECMNLRTGYDRLQGIYRNRERHWNTAGPIFETRYDTDSDLTGNHIFIEGTRIINRRFGLQGRYDFQNYDLEADSVTSYSKDLVGKSIISRDVLNQHTASLQINLYPGSKTTLWWRGTYTREHIRRTYPDSTQTTDAIRHHIQLHAGIEYDLNRTFGICGEYGYLRQSGDVSIDDEQEPFPLATYETERNRHTLTLSLIGRF